MTNTFTTLRRRIITTAFLLFLTVLSNSNVTAQKVWKNVGQASFSAGHVSGNAIAIDSLGAPYVVFSDSANGNKATVMKYNGSSWVTVGAAGFSAGSISEPSIAIDSHSYVYVAYADGSLGGRLTVKKYVSGSWITMGAAGISAGTVNSPSIAIGRKRTPYVAYVDDYIGYTATVVTFVDTAGIWVPIGGTGFLGSQVGYTDLAIDTSGAPFLVFEDFMHNYGASVVRYDRSSNSWAYVDTANFSNGWAIWTSIVFDKRNVPYITYQDCADSNRITVKKLVSGHWVTVGARGFSAKTVQYPGIAIDSVGMPYVVYSDWNLGSAATVMNFDATAWVTSGTMQGFSAGAAKYTTIATDEWGTPYVSFMDSSRKATVMKLGTAPIAGQDSICINATVHMTDITSGGTWSSSNTTVATIDPNSGFLNAVAAGTTTITYSILHDPVYLVVTVNNCVAGVSNVNANDKSLSVFPAPNHGAFTVRIASAQKETVAVTITNMMGQQVKEVNISTNTDAPIQLDAAPGIYFISAATSQGRLSEKVVVE